jgi:NADH dehydrogenase
LTERGKNSFEAVQSEGAARIAKFAAEQGVSQMVHISAIGADAASASEYSRTKAAGEAAVLEAFPAAVILRPSVIFGTEDQFFNRFAKMTEMSPVLPLVGGNTKFQPVYVDDVAQAAVQAALGNAPAGTYELGGPDQATLKALMGTLLAKTQSRRMIVNLPFFVGKLMAFGFSALQFCTLGIFKNTVLTSDQVKNLAVDNVVSEDAKSFADLNIQPTPLETILPEYLWVYRDTGQYASIRDSAKNLRQT